MRRTRGRHRLLGTLPVAVLLALATSRTEAAIEFLLGVVRTGTGQASAMAVSAMGVNMGDRRIQEQVDKALAARRAEGSPGRGLQRRRGPE